MPVSSDPPRRTEVEEVNRTYYDALYGRRHPAVVLLHGTLSFDQQVKARPNAAMVRALLPELRSRHPGREISVLDFGCGWGATLRRLPSDLKLFGYDLSDGALRALRRAAELRRREVGIAEVDAEGRILPGSFDIIVCSHVLEHVADDVALLRRFVAALAEGGCVVLNVPINELHPDEKHVRAYTAEKLRERLTKAGLVPKLELPTDRWSALIIDHELCRPAPPWKRLGLRGLRALLALTPLGVLRASGDLLLRRYPHQQLLVVASRASATSDVAGPAAGRLLHGR